VGTRAVADEDERQAESAHELLMPPPGAQRAASRKSVLARSAGEVSLPR
jgi:hypothetical protein